ncbi:MAG: hypothetical protein IPP45_14790 [Sphingomonadales bacterium]|nr:hypothetical protein [Sphingomonadales bacterium]
MFSVRATACSDPATRVFPGHDYKGNSESRIGQRSKPTPPAEAGSAEFVAMMREPNSCRTDAPDRSGQTNMSGGITVEQLLSEARPTVPLMSLAELHDQLARGANDLTVRCSRNDARKGPFLVHLARGQLELRINDLSSLT